MSVDDGLRQRENGRMRYLVLLTALVAGCGGRNPAAQAPPVTVARPAPARASRDEPIEPRSWGPLGERAPVRLIVDTRALRATPYGRELARVLSRASMVTTFKAVSGVDIFADADWFAAFGSNFVDGDASAIVVHHVLGPDTLGPHTDKAPGSKQVFGRPRPELAVLVPTERAPRTLAELAAEPHDPHVPSGVLAGFAMQDAPSRFPLLPREISSVVVEARVADSSGVDLRGTARCYRDTGERAREKLRNTAKALTGLLREDLRDAVSPLQSDGLELENDRIRASLHFTPDQLRSLTEMLESFLISGP